MVALGDLDGDGDLDAFLTSTRADTGTNQVWLNQNLTPATPMVTLSVDSATISEGSGVARLTATLDSAATNGVTVDLAFGGTAANGTDYAPSSTQIVIPAGIVSGEVLVTAVNDTLDEPDETIVVDIATVMNGAEAGTQQVTILIVDDDLPPPARLRSFSPSANSHSAPVTTDIMAEFDQQIDGATATPETFSVHSMQRGQLIGPSATVTTNGTVVLVNPADFFPGELVQVSVTESIESTIGGPGLPHVWQFRTSVSTASGIFGHSGQNLGTQKTFDAALGDLDGNGELDAFVVNLSEGNSVWLNNGGKFTDAEQALGDHASADVSLGDLDRDGDLDAFVANVNQGNRVWLNEGGIFSDSGQHLGNHWSLGATLGDLDGDGDLDAFVANDEEGNRVWFNDGDGRFSDGGQILGDHDARAVETWRLRRGWRPGCLCDQSARTREPSLAQQRSRSIHRCTDTG